MFDEINQVVDTLYAPEKTKGFSGSNWFAGFFVEGSFEPTSLFNDDNELIEYIIYALT